MTDTGLCMCAVLPAVLGVRDMSLSLGMGGCSKCVGTISYPAKTKNSRLHKNYLGIPTGDLKLLHRKFHMH